MVTEFQKKVYEIVKKIPRGKVTTYKAIAEKLKTSPRAVGQALKRNPYSYNSCDFRRITLKKSLHRNRKGSLQKKPLRCLLVPCHRVICSNMKIGGYAGNNPENIKKKIKLLKKEGVKIKFNQS